MPQGSAQRRRVQGRFERGRAYNRGMPPRHSYWTILIDNQPTAFRAHDPEELLPTLNRLREKNEWVVMKWFERGQLFDSRDAAKEVGFGKGERRWEGPRPERPDDVERQSRGPRGESRGPAGESRGPAGGSRGPSGESRGPRKEGDRRRDKTWRPGGEHRDPRQKYKDAKKAKWTRFKEKIRERHEERTPRGPESFTPPHGDELRGRPEPDDRGGFRDRRPADRRYDEQREWKGPGPSRPHGDKFREQRPKPWNRNQDRGPDRDRPQWRDRPPRKPDTRRDSHRNAGPGDRRDYRREVRRDDRGDHRRESQRDDQRERFRDDRRDNREGRRDNRGDWRDNQRDNRRDGPRDERQASGSARGGSDRFGPTGKFGGPRKPWGAKPGGARPSGPKFAARKPAGPRRRRDDED